MASAMVRKQNEIGNPPKGGSKARKVKRERVARLRVLRGKITISNIRYSMARPN